MKLIDRTGQRYGHLTVISRAENIKHPCGKETTAWKCLCDCGKYTIVDTNNLRGGSVRSCGCRQMENARKALYKHGDTVSRKKSRIYRIWSLMKQRCTDPNMDCFKNYGLRGIRVCDDWMDYEKFKSWALSNGYSDNLTIDRINVNGNYEPGNCRWATKKEQANNKRNNHYITIAGKTQTLSMWMKTLNLSQYQVLKHFG